MTHKQAIEIFRQVAARFIGTRSEHEIVEQAIQTLADDKKTDESTSHAR